MAQEYFIRKDEETVGPLRMADIISSAQSGALLMDTEVSDEETNSWFWLWEHPDFAVSDDALAAAIKSLRTKTSWLGSFFGIVGLLAIFGILFFQSGQWVKWIPGTAADWSRQLYVLTVKDSSGDKRLALYRRFGQPNLLPFNADSFEQPTDGMLPFSVHGKWGFYEIGKKAPLPAEYDEVKQFSEGVAPVQIAGKWGYIDKKGQTKINPQFADAQPFTEGVAAVLAPDLKLKTMAWRLIDSNGHYVTDTSWDFIGPVMQDRAPVMQNGVWGYINKQGRLVTKLEYQAALPFLGEMAAVCKDGKWGFIDASGTMSLNPVWEDAWSFTEKLAAVKCDGRWGFIDPTGKTVVDFQFDNAMPFSNGIAAVATGGKWGLITPKGLFIVKPRFEHIAAFDGNLSVAQDQGKPCFVDEHGNVISPVN